MFAALLIALTVVTAEPQEERFLDGLRSRRLFSLAESYCLERLSDSSLPENRRAELVVELSRTFAEHALYSAPKAAEPLWEQAFAVTTEFARRLPESRWQVLVRTQAALVLLARGELARQQNEAVPNEQVQNEARLYLRRAVSDLVDLRQEVAKTLAETRPGEGDARRPSREQLQSLDRNLAFQLSRAYRNQGQSYPAGSPDRANSLSKAVELLGPLAQHAQVDALVWQARLEEIVCYRLLGDAAAAARRLDALLQQKEAPPDIQLRARAEHIRLAMAMNRLDLALGTAQAARTVNGHTSADLDLAALEAFAAAWRYAEQDQEADQARQWQERASSLISEIDRRHGSYWSRRAESVMAGQISTSTIPPSDLDLLVRAAESHYRSGRLDAAIAAYDRAGEFAAKNEDPQRAFDLAYAAAMIEHGRKEHRKAADRFRKLALSMSRQQRAGEAHLLAIYNAAEEARQREPASLDEYGALLEEHLRTWTTGRTADQASWLLGRLKEHQGDWPAAIDAYRRVSPEHPQFAAAVDAITRGYAELIQQRQGEGQATEDLVTAAAGYFEGQFLDQGNRFPDRWTPLQRQAALAAARIWLLASEPNYDRAEQIVRAALADASGIDPALQASLRGILVASAAGQGRVEVARQSLSDLAAAGPTELLGLLDALANLTAAARPEGRKPMALLAVDVARMLLPRRGELSPAGQAQFDRLEAQVLADAGQADEALRRYAQLARQFPRDGAVQERYATLLVEAGDRASLEAALAKWREVEQRSQSATPRWFRAKYYLALAHEKLGNKEHAAKIVTLTQVLHPDLGGPELKARFQDLLTRCKQR